MQFLAPLFLAGAVLIVLPIVLHLFRRDVAPQVPFTAVRLLRRTPLERSRSWRLRDVLLLAARVAALLLLAASFARPYHLGAAGSSRLTIVAVDRSFSMGAPGRFARAIDIARAELDRASSQRVALVAFDDRADVISAPGAAADARAALATLRPGAGATRFAPVMEKAAELSAGESATRLVVVSDLQRTGFDGGQAALPESVDLDVRDAGATPANLALTDLRIDRTTAVAIVRSYGAAAATTVQVSAGSRPLASRSVMVPANSAVAVSFDGVPAGPVRAAIVDRGGYAADNERFAVSAERQLPRVLLVTGPPGSSNGFYVRNALLAGGDGGPDFDVRTLTGPAFAALPAAEVSRAAAVVLLSTHGIDRRTAASFKALFAAGGGLLVAAAPEVDASVLSTVLEWDPPLAPGDDEDTGALAVSDIRHPMLRPFDGIAANFAQVAFAHAWRVEPGTAWRVLATFSRGDAALLERPAGHGRVVLFASDVDRRWNDFPLHPSFVPFVQEAARYLGAHRPETAAWVVADVPDGIRAVPGIATTAAGPRPINVDARESAVEHLTASEFRQMVVRSAGPSPVRAELRGRQTEASQAFWRYGLALMLAILILEAFVGAR